MMGTLLFLLLQAVTTPASQPAPKLVRAEIGPSGAPRAGSFVLDEQRDTFDVSTDARVYVVFEWQGVPGAHKCELSWIAPDGSVALQSVLDLNAPGSKFSGYWALVLNPTIARGLWAAEVKVDGHKAGSRTFRISGPPIVRALPPDELYKKATEVTIKMSAKVRDGAPRAFSGFAVGPDAIITTFGALNGADSIDIEFPGGTRAQSTEVWSFSRELDWALVKATVPEAVRGLRVADVVKVGDPCLFLDVVDGQRQMSPCSILGENRTSSVLRFTIGTRPSDAAVGSPLLNQYGHVIGMVGAASRGGIGTFADERTRWKGGRAPLYSLVVLPAKGIQRPETGEAEGLAKFWERGSFFPPVTADEALHGTMYPGIRKPGPEGLPLATSFEFSSQDGGVTAVVYWQSSEKRDRMLNHAVYDYANRAMVVGKPLKVAFRPGQRFDSASPVEIRNFAPGEYRFDVLLDGQVAWRSYFTVR